MNLPNELLPGKTYSATRIDDNKEEISILCDSIEQRNWSRAAPGRSSDINTDTPKNYFLKQNINKSGTMLPRTACQFFLFITGSSHNEAVYFLWFFDSHISFISKLFVNR